MNYYHQKRLNNVLTILILKYGVIANDPTQNHTHNR